MYLTFARHALKNKSTQHADKMPVSRITSFIFIIKNMAYIYACVKVSFAIDEFRWLLWFSLLFDGFSIGASAVRGKKARVVVVQCFIVYMRVYLRSVKVCMTEQFLNAS